MIDAHCGRRLDQRGIDGRTDTISADAGERQRDVRQQPLEAKPPVERPLESLPLHRERDEPEDQYGLDDEDRCEKGDAEGRARGGA